MKLKIPSRNRDLRQYVLRRRFGKLFAYLLWISAFFGGAMAYNNSHRTYPEERLILGWRLIIWMLIGVLLGFVIFRIGRLLRDRSFEGVILQSGLSHTYEASADPGAANPVNYDFRLNTYLTVKTDRGKRRRLQFEQKQGFYLYYYEGSHLCHFAGLPYPICDPRRHCKPDHVPIFEKANDDLSGGYVCVACGFMNASPQVRCGRCRHTIIDPEELWQDGAEGDRTEQEKEGRL